MRDKLSDARKRYEDEYRRPLERRGEVPDHIQFSSIKDALALEVTQAGRGQLAAAADPPARPDGHDMTMRLHESAVNNYSAITLSGATVSQKRSGPGIEVRREDAQVAAGRLEEAENRIRGQGRSRTKAFKPWSLRFRPSRPDLGRFCRRQGEAHAAHRPPRIGSSEPFTGWDVWGTFVPELKDGGLVLRREGELDALPTNFRGNLGSVQAAQRNNLIKELNSRSAQGEGFPSDDRV